VAALRTCAKGIEDKGYDVSFLVVIAVTVLVVVFVRSSRKQRAQWLQKLDLLGRWQWDSGDETLTLSGALDHGTFVREVERSQVRGDWQLVGHELRLVSQDGTETFDLRLFRPGCIGLEDASGRGRVYEKTSDNVVPLSAARKP
jgi:hypothetical protein